MHAGRPNNRESNSAGILGVLQSNSAGQKCDAPAWPASNLLCFGPRCISHILRCCVLARACQNRLANEVLGNGQQKWTRERQALPLPVGHLKWTRERQALPLPVLRPPPRAREAPGQSDNCPHLHCGLHWGVERTGRSPNALCAATHFCQMHCALRQAGSRKAAAINVRAELANTKPKAQCLRGGGKAVTVRVLRAHTRRNMNRARRAHLHCYDMFIAVAQHDTFGG